MATQRKGGISWTNQTWNVVSGCTKVSPGCDHCYAERYSRRHIGDWSPDKLLCGIRDFGDVECHHRRLEQPLHWRKPRMVMVPSMGDLFHDDVPFKFIHEVWDMMKRTPQHTYQVLTKRPERMKEVVEMIYKMERMGWAKGFWNHVWLGVTAENQEMADKRIPILLSISAAVHFVSVEPMLGELDLSRWLSIRKSTGLSEWTKDGAENLIDWIICGGESGPGARPMHPDWARSLRDQAVAAGVPFHFKQWGSYVPITRIDGVQEMPFGDFIPEKKFGYFRARNIKYTKIDGVEWMHFPERAK